MFNEYAMNLNENSNVKELRLHYFDEIVYDWWIDSNLEEYYAKHFVQ